MSDTSALAETVCRDIDAAREELIDLCGQLVAAASVNPPGRTAEVADVVRGYLSSHGIAHETVKADDEAPNVVASIQGGAGGRHVVFNAHMDTMEAGDEFGVVGADHAPHPPRRTPLRSRHGQHEGRTRRDVPRHGDPQPARQRVAGAADDDRRLR